MSAYHRSARVCIIVARAALRRAQCASLLWRGGLQHCSGGVLLVCPARISIAARATCYGQLLCIFLRANRGNFFAIFMHAGPIISSNKKGQGAGGVRSGCGFFRCTLCPVACGLRTGLGPRGGNNFLGDRPFADGLALKQKLATISRNCIELEFN